ncbi:MAG: TlyA family RNA methyltransferase [Huintestinicola sp.]
MRLDIYLAEKNMVKSRELSKKIIISGGVEVNGKIVTKPSLDINDNDNVVITADMPKYVGRGGLKLEKALDVFGISVTDKVCIDIGASTGGFTDCMLQRGASFVYAVDVGHDQLDEKLKNDPRVANMEGYNVRYASADDFGRNVDFICCDVSFISLKNVIPAIALLLNEHGTAVMLIKPQFECGKSNIGKGGIVRSDKAIASAIREIAACVNANSLQVCGLDYSPVKGGDGNIEFLMCISRDLEIKEQKVPEIIIESARKNLK